MRILLKEFFKEDKKVEYFEEITSTNTVLKERAMHGGTENTILISEFQTAGRGRLGKTFFSPKGCGVYLSYLIKPDILACDAVFITVAAAVAIRRALKSVFNIDTKIKWVNDIYFNNKKLCGILTEGGISSNGKLDYAVLGIGLNIKNPPNGYPDDFAFKTTNLEEITGTTSDEKKWQFIGEFINIFDNIFSDKERSYTKEYKKASCLIGKEIEILSGEHKGPAFVRDIDDYARLIVDVDGKIYALDSGDVSIKFS